MKKIRIDKLKIKYFNDIKKIYNNSFPRKERFPLIILLLNIIRKNSEMFVLLDNNMVCAFIYCINYGNMTFILYLAVDPEKRNNGYGSYLLNWILEKKKNNKIFLNIDKIDDNYEDSDIRKKRLDFYINNHFYITNYLSVERCSNFHILSTDKKFEVNEYIKLDKQISLCFFNSPSKIVKIDDKLE